MYLSAGFSEKNRMKSYVQIAIPMVGIRNSILQNLHQ